MSRTSRDGSRLPASADDTPTPPAASGRITVALIDKAAADLQSTHERTGLSKTDIVNRALSLYEFFDTKLSAGAEVIIREDGKDFLLKLL